MVLRPRRYEASSMPDALRRIRAELGPDAVILDVRPVRRGGLLGWLRRSGRAMEVWAASSDALAGAYFPRPVAAGQSSFPGGEDIGARLGRLEAAIAELCRPSRLGPLPGTLERQHRRLLEQGVDEQLADELVRELLADLSPRALASEASVASALRQRLAALLPVRGPVRLPDGGRKVLFLIGPTGVGKTTTLAKLAADFALAQRKRVVLLTADTFRIGAVEQLGTYAEIMGLPMEVAYTPGELAELLGRHSRAELVLVDTPGRSQRRSDQVRELRSFLDAAPNAEVHLTIAANTRYEDMLEVVRSFATGAVHGLVFTKLDETEAYGSAISVAYRTGIPVSYLTTGQNVPEDIEPASADRLAGLVLGDRREELETAVAGAEVP